MAKALDALKEYYRLKTISDEEELNSGVDDVGTEALSKVFWAILQKKKLNLLSAHVNCFAS